MDDGDTMARESDGCQITVTRTAMETGHTENTPNDAGPYKTGQYIPVPVQQSYIGPVDLAD